MWYDFDLDLDFTLMENGKDLTLLKSNYLNDFCLKWGQDHQVKPNEQDILVCKLVILDWILCYNKLSKLIILLENFNNFDIMH